MKKIYYIPITIFCFVLIYFFFVNSDKKDTKELFVEKIDINTVNNLEKIKKVEIPKYEKKIIVECNSYLIKKINKSFITE